MKSNFIIYQSCTDDNRPPISYRVREYFVKFVSDNVLEKKKIIINGKYNTLLAIFFSGGGPKVLYKDIGFAKGSRFIKEENVKIYEIFILLNAIQKAKNPYLRTIELMYEAIKIFLTTTYKKITPEFMDELWSKVDLDYLLSLPYPAPLSEQRYVGDIVTPDGGVQVLRF